MNPIDASVPLATIVTEHPGLARHLERLGLDYCCGGRTRLGDACAELGLDPVVVGRELGAEVIDMAPAEWAVMTPEDMVDHIEATHHAYLHDEIPRIEGLLEKVERAHGERHPELASVRATFDELAAELDPHLAREEQVLFPLVRRMASCSPDADTGPSLVAPIRVMLVDHDRAGELLLQLRGLTAGYVAPADGCASYRALYQALAEVEADTHLHVHKENNVLFPAVLEAAAGARGVAL